MINKILVSVGFERKIEGWLRHEVPCFIIMTTSAHSLKLKLSTTLPTAIAAATVTNRKENKALFFIQLKLIGF